MSGSTGAFRPGTVSVGEVIGILVIAVIGGLRHPIGPFLGAALYVFLKTFAIDIVGADRFNTLIGAIFLVVVFVSPDGLLGSWRRIAPALGAKAAARSVSCGGSLFNEVQTSGLQSWEEAMKNA